MPTSAERRHELVEEQVLLLADQLARPGRAISSSCCAGRAPVGRGCVEPGGHLVLQPATRTWKNSSRFC